MGRKNRRSNRGMNRRSKRSKRNRRTKRNKMNRRSKRTKMNRRSKRSKMNRRSKRTKMRGGEGAPKGVEANADAEAGQGEKAAAVAMWSLADRSKEHLRLMRLKNQESKPRELRK
jgi:hypothetical protein